MSKSTKLDKLGTDFLNFSDKIRRAEYLFEMLTKNDIFFTAGSWEKDNIFGGHFKQIFGPSYFVRALVMQFEEKLLSCHCFILSIGQLSIQIKTVSTFVY